MKSKKFAKYIDTLLLGYTLLHCSNFANEKKAMNNLSEISGSILNLSDTTVVKIFSDFKETSNS